MSSAGITFVDQWLCIQLHRHPHPALFSLIEPDHSTTGYQSEWVSRESDPSASPEEAVTVLEVAEISAAR